MNVSAFIQSNLKIVWVIMGLSALILLFGWLTSRWIAKIVAGLINRTPVVNLIVKRFNFPDVELVNQRIQQTTRLIVILFTVWGAWQTLSRRRKIIFPFPSVTIMMRHMYPIV